MQEEIWKDITGYKGIYQVSSLGNVKSLPRLVPTSKGIRKYDGKRLKPAKSSNNYLDVVLRFKGINKTTQVHVLVAKEFLNHTPCGHKLVVNHKNHIKTDNRVENLELITQRENANKKHLKSSSKYTGVSWNKAANKWHSGIRINGKQKHLGLFENEYDAHLAYEKELNRISNKPQLI